jgi:hypothetical protein
MRGERKSVKCMIESSVLSRHSLNKVLLSRVIIIGKFPRCIDSTLATQLINASLPQGPANELW